MKLIERMQMISRLYTEVVHPLTLWQAAYLAKGDESGVQKIENMLTLLNEVTTAMQADVMDYGKEDMIAKQWQQKWIDDMAVAQAKINELEQMIATEEYFTTRTKKDTLPKQYR